MKILIKFFFQNQLFVIRPIIVTLPKSFGKLAIGCVKLAVKRAVKRRINERSTTDTYKLIIYLELDVFDNKLKQKKITKARRSFLRIVTNATKGFITDFISIAVASS